MYVRAFMLDMSFGEANRTARKYTILFQPTNCAALLNNSPTTKKVYSFVPQSATLKLRDVHENKGN